MRADSKWLTDSREGEGLKVTLIRPFQTLPWCRCTRALIRGNSRAVAAKNAEGRKVMKKKRRESVSKMVQAGVLLALGLILPIFTGQIPKVGQMLLPMHIPILLCGFLCGPRYGLLVGIVCPLFRSTLFGVPPIFPTALAMAFELGTYGFVSGYLYSRSRWQCVLAAEKCLLAAMIAGRLVWGAVMFLLLHLMGQNFTIQAFLSGALLTAIPGIIIQLFLIPMVLYALNRAGLVPFRKAGKQPAAAS